MSYAFIAALKKNPQQSYVQLLNSIRDELEGKYDQKPQLSCSHPLDTDILYVSHCLPAIQTATYRILTRRSRSCKYCQTTKVMRARHWVCMIRCDRRIKERMKYSRSWPGLLGESVVMDTGMHFSVGGIVMASTRVKRYIFVFFHRFTRLLIWTRCSVI
jgi:hypothetical protein